MAATEPPLATPYPGLDPLLAGFCAAADGPPAERILEDLMTREAEPLAEDILRHQFRRTHAAPPDRTITSRKLCERRTRDANGLVC